LNPLETYIDYSSTVSIIMIIVVAIELLITVLLAIYTIKKKRDIEYSAAALFLIVGIISSLASIFTFIGEPTDIICIIRPYVIVIAFGLTFFSLFVEYLIINDRDCSTTAVYLVIIFIANLVLVTVWAIKGGIKSNVWEYDDEVYYYYSCKNTIKIGDTFQNILIVLNGLTLFYGFFYCIKHDSEFSWSIYVVFFSMVALMVIVNIKSLSTNTLFITQSLIIILLMDFIMIRQAVQIDDDAF